MKNAVCTLVDRGFIDIGKYTCDNLPMHEPLSIIQGRFCVIGLKVLPSMVLGVVTDLRCKVLSIGADGKELTASRNLPPGQHDETSVVQAVAELVQALVEQIPEGYGVLGAGVELGGHVKRRDGTVVYSPNLDWRNVPLGERLNEVLSERLKSVLGKRFDPTGFQVVVENDVNALAVAAQWWGAGRGHESFAVVLVGDGIGCGLVINNELVHGATGIAGEIGHLVVEPGDSGLRCRCGKPGCLEAIATIPMILQAIADAKRERGEDPPATITEAVELAEKGDKLAEEAFEVAGEALARAISYLLNLVNPEKLILETYELGVTQLLMKIVPRRLKRYCFSTTQTDCDFPLMNVALERGAKGAAGVMIIGLLSQGLPAHMSVRGAP